MSKGPAVHRKARHPDQWYQEEQWVSERLFAVEPFRGVICDPCAGAGSITHAAARAGLPALAFDLRNQRGAGVQAGWDFFGDGWPHGSWPVDNIVSNPPYARFSETDQKRPDGGMARMEDEFLRLALLRARSKVALFLPTGWLSGADRSSWISTTPFYREYRCTPRPSCPPGDYIAASGKVGGGQTDYSWFIWLIGFTGDATIRFLRRDAGSRKATLENFPANGQGAA